MTKHRDKDKENLEQEDILEQMEEEIIEVENEDWSINEEKLEEAVSSEDYKCKDILLKTQADFANFKARTERDKADMVFFLKQDIFKKILPALDDLERIIKATLEGNRNTPIYEWVVALQKKLTSDLEKIWVKAFISLEIEVNPDKHDVMTTVPWKPEGIICDEFEKGYELDGRVLRHAKVVVWAGE
jgi:molecular chaperone GrpE